MKRTLIPVLVGCACLLHGRLTFGGDDSSFRVSPLQIGITEKHQLAPKDWSIWGLSLGLPKATNKRANGIDIGWDNWTSESWFLLEAGADNHVVKGSAIQVGLKNALSCGYVDDSVGAGLQLALVQNSLAGYGIQAGGCNYNSGHHGGGIQAGLFFNEAEAFDGIQVAGFNCEATGFAGIQLSGFTSVATNFTGIQVSGDTCCSNSFGGTQLGWLRCHAGETDGAQVAGLASTADNLNGLQVAGIECESGIFNGVQITGGGCEAKEFKGLQVSGFSGSADDVGGIQVAGLFSSSDDFVGLQLAGLECDAQNVRGIQASAPLLIGGNAAKRLQGLQVGLGLLPRKICLAAPTNSLPAGASSSTAAQKGSAKSGKSFCASNNADTLDGLQIGLLFNYVDEARGLQISLLYNEATEISGLQVGLVNVAEKMTGVQIGFLNFIDTSSCSRMPLINAHF